MNSTFIFVKALSESGTETCTLCLRFPWVGVGVGGVH